ncbi:MAG: hypothetical protein WKF59_05380 [Chitinophagaceae bacterium]
MIFQKSYKTIKNFNYETYVICFFIPYNNKRQLQKTVTPPPPVTEELPPVTQEGKNTCGFLVNGKVWLPKGRVGNGSPNLKVWYDPAYHNGTFNINGLGMKKVKEISLQVL